MDLPSGRAVENQVESRLQFYKSWFWRIITWNSASSSTMLRLVEKSIFSYLKKKPIGYYVDIGSAVGESDKIWTICLNSEANTNSPLVLLHGLGAGVGLWVMNLDPLSEKRTVYAIDMLGFGRSSRPDFSNDSMLAEKQFVKSIEEWRNEVGVNKMVLLGHSMGGFLAASYSISYPDRVQHLILADPWGFPEKPKDISNKYNIPFWVKAIAFAMAPLNPLWALRVVGPFGQWVVEKARPDITRKFSPLIKDEQLIPQYIHQCNAQTPSGESAFHAMMANYGWAKNPMLHRITDLRRDIPITLLYGSRSWIDSSAGEKLKMMRPNSYVNLQVISGAGHHVYADKPEIFNKYVNEVCDHNENGSSGLNRVEAKS